MSRCAITLPGSAAADYEFCAAQLRGQLAADGIRVVGEVEVRVHHDLLLDTDLVVVCAECVHPA